MTTEIWVTDFYNQTKQTIPDNKELSSIQKSKLIHDLETFLPPCAQANSHGLSSTQFGHIIDKGNGSTSISTTRRVDINIEGSNKYISRRSTWDKPITISKDNDEIAFIILSGYSIRKPISVKNVEPPLQTPQKTL